MLGRVVVALLRSALVWLRCTDLPLKTNHSLAGRFAEAPLQLRHSTPQEELAAGLEDRERLGSFAIQVKKNAFPRIGFVQGFAERGDTGDSFSVYFRDDVFALYILSSGETVVSYVGYDHSLLNIQFQTGRDFLGQFLDLQPELV